MDNHVEVEAQAEQEYTPTAPRKKRKKEEFTTSPFVKKNRW